MVKIWICVIGALLAFLPLAAVEVKIQANLDNYTVGVDQPIKGTLSITHYLSEKIDPNSFKIEGKPLEVKYAQDTKISDTSDLVVSFYSFMLPGKPKGLHVLPPISVVVGGEQYQSLATTYEASENVKTAPTIPYFSQSSPAPTPTTSGRSSPQPIQDATLKMEGNYSGMPPFYPGQKIKMFYRYYFNTNIELTDETLPLLDAPGFRKIGSREINDTQEGNYSVREISQMVVATKPGKYDFQGAVVDGYLYKMDDFGQRQYQKPKIHVETLPLALTVNPFPEKGRPASFNGAIGPFNDFKVSLLSPSTVAIGDKIVLGIDISGEGALDTAPAPDLCCQPGFSGVFQTSDLPPTEKIEGKSKHFEVELRPLTDAVKAVPVVEFAFFDPATQSYGVLHSQQISLDVHADRSTTPAPTPTKTNQPTSVNWQNQPSPSAIPEDMKWVEGDGSSGSWNKAWWIFLLIPLGILLLFLQKKKHTEIVQRPAVIKPIHSKDLFDASLKMDPKSADFHKQLTKAFLMRLVEKGGLPTTETTVEKLPTKGKAGQVRALLMELEERRYSGKEASLDKSFQSRAKELFDSL